jgi:hypothetical protein
MDDATVNELERHWEDGWNAGDLATIMAPYAEDVIFSSPFVGRMTGDPAQTTITGYDALKSYVADALERAGHVRYRLDNTFVGTDTLILVYTCGDPDGPARTGSDLMRVNGDNKIVEWRSHYSFSPDDAPELVRD